MRDSNSSHESPVCYSLPPILFYQQNNFQMWRFDFDVELNSHCEQVCYYRLPQEHRIFSFKIPALSQKPGILFCSCNDRYVHVWCCAVVAGLKYCAIVAGARCCV